MMAESGSVSRLKALSKSSRWSRFISFLFGVIIVVFFTLLGSGIESATEVVNFSSPLFTVVRAASVGLGTGYYLGASLESGSRSRQWVLLGAFTALAVWGFFTLNIRLFWQVPASALIPVGGVLSILAQITPAVQNTEEYREAYRFLSGTVTSVAVVLLSTIEFLSTLVQRFLGWFLSVASALIVDVLALLVTLLVGIYIGAWGMEAERQEG